MKESYNEGVASHIGPESCLDDPRGRGEALTGESTGGLLSSEITEFRSSTSWTDREDNTGMDVESQVHDGTGGVAEPSMCGRLLHGNRETSGRSRDGSNPTIAGNPEKAESRTAGGNAPEESDSTEVPKKPANKASAAAELAEERVLTKRNTQGKAASGTQIRRDASSRLERVRQRAGADKDCRFDNLFTLLTPDHLRLSFYGLNRQAKPGVDGVTWFDYETELEANIADLHDRLHKGKYRARPVAREYIEKDNGELRPLGITAVEDKLVQQAVVRILNEVYEQDFRNFSYGYRPGRSQHDALDALHAGITKKKVNWILDADLQAFFDTIKHDQLLELLQIRMTDKRMLRLVRKWLKTGWIENGQRHVQTVGTPQGSVISPLLANVFLHYALDEWVTWYRHHHCRGDVIITRYADDFVIGFQHKGEADAMLSAVRSRLADFGLRLHPAKTRLIEFGRFAKSNRCERGQTKPETFDFLGFTHSCASNRKGWFSLRRTTSRKRFRRKVQEVKKKLREMRHAPMRDVGKWLNSVIVGHQNYFAVPGNMDRVKEFYTQVVTLWLKQIRRRSQKGRDKWTWERFTRWKDWLITRVRCAHPLPNDRFDAKYSR